MRQRATWRSTSSRRPRPWRATWPSAGCPSFWTSTTSRLRSTSPAGSRGACSGRRRRRTSWRCWPPGRCSGWPRAPSANRSSAGRGAGTPRSFPSWRTTGASPGPRTPGWRRNWPGSGRAGAPTSSSSGGSCPPRPSTSWSRRCGPTAGSTTAKARLHLVGGTSSFEYTKALQDFVDDLGLSAAVRLPGEVSDAALAAYFEAADVYLSLSAHEGFGVPLVEAMVAGVPVVTRGAGAVADTVADAALVLAAADPSYVAAALHRVVQRRAAPRHVDRRRRAPRRGALRRRRRPHHRCRRRGGGATMSGKVVFVTPRYGTQVMGGAETAARQLAEHLRRPHELAGRGPYDLRPRPPHLGRRAAAGDHRDQRGAGAPPSVGARSPSRFLRPRRAPPADPPPGHVGAGEAVGRLQRPGFATAGRCGRGVGCRRGRLLPVPVPPHRGHHRQGEGAGGAAPGGARRACAVPARVPRHLRGRRRLLLPHRVRTRARGADVPGGGAAADRARARRGRVGGTGPAPVASSSGWATARTS